MFEYLTHVVPVTGLQPFLTEKGREGWRLHTCDPLRKKVGEVEVATEVLVVMDRIAEQKQDPVGESPNGDPEGMACRG